MPKKELIKLLKQSIKDCFAHLSLINGYEREMIWLNQELSDPTSGKTQLEIVNKIKKNQRDRKYREKKLYSTQEKIDKIIDMLYDPAEMFDAQDYLNKINIWNHPTITDVDNNSFDVAQIMADFANEYYGKNKKEEKC